MSLFDRKPIAALDTSDSPQSLKRVLGAGDLVMLAIGAVIGAGIFGAIGTAAAGQLGPNNEVIRQGAGPALESTAGGHTLIAFSSLPAAVPLVKSGSLRALATTSVKRLAALPDVPTMAEQGVPDFVSGTWAGIIAPAGTPKEIVDRVSAEAKKALADPAMKDKLAEQGIVAVGSTPEEFRAFVAEEISRWNKVITDAGIKME